MKYEPTGEWISKDELILYLCCNINGEFLHGNQKITVGEVRDVISNLKTTRVDSVLKPDGLNFMSNHFGDRIK